MSAWGTPRADEQPTTLPSLHRSVYLSRRTDQLGERSGEAVTPIGASVPATLPPGPRGARPFETGNHRPGLLPVRRGAHAGGAAPRCRARAAVQTTGRECAPGEGA